MLKMTVNRQWLAREWLFLLAGLACAFVINFIPYVRGLAWWIPYTLFQMTRATILAVRTLPEPEIKGAARIEPRPTFLRLGRNGRWQQLERSQGMQKFSPETGSAAGILAIGSRLGAISS